MKKNNDSMWKKKKRESKSRAFEQKRAMHGIIYTNGIYR